MIIFTLDALADDSHRRHLIDHRLVPHTVIDGSAFRQFPKFYDEETDSCIVPCDPNWKPDYEAYYKLADQDKPLWKTIEHAKYHIHRKEDSDVQIWCDRDECFRQQIFDWLFKHEMKGFTVLKMRPDDDKSSDAELKEFFIEDRISDMGNQAVHDITMVFEHTRNQEAIQMFKSKGITVFEVHP